MHAVNTKVYYIACKTVMVPNTIILHIVLSPQQSHVRLPLNFLISLVFLDSFQVVVLARIIPDEEQAISSAAGIKLLVDLLHDSSSNEILGLAADCIARLAHTRAGEKKNIMSYVMNKN